MDLLDQFLFPIAARSNYTNRVLDQIDSTRRSLRR